MKRFYEAYCNSIDKETMIDVCLYRMANGYVFFGESFIYLFFQTEKAVRRTNESVKRTPKSI